MSGWERIAIEIIWAGEWIRYERLTCGAWRLQTPWWGYRGVQHSGLRVTNITITEMTHRSKNINTLSTKHDTILHKKSRNCRFHSGNKTASLRRAISGTRGCTYIGLSPHRRCIFTLANKLLEVPVGKIILLRVDKERTYLHLASCHMVSVCTAHFVFAQNQQIILV